MSLHSGFMNSTIICNEKKTVDLDALNLLASGAVEELCVCAYKSKNSHHHFIYDTNDMVSLEEFQGGLSFENAVEILFSALRLIEKLKENKLQIENIKNAKEYIFQGDQGYQFIYIPIICKSRMRIRDYLLKLIAVIHLKDVRIAKLAKGIRKRKSDEEAIAYFSEFLVSYHRLDDEHSEDETSLFFEEEETMLLNLPSGEEDTTLQNAETTLLSVDSHPDIFDSAQLDETIEENRATEITSYLKDESSEYETTVLTSQPNPYVPPSHDEAEEKSGSKPSLYLIRSRTGEKIFVDITPFTIGKDAANMDYILNNESVSRHHATIVYEEETYYIMDQHSTNGTTIEGIRLQPYEKAELGNGCIFSLGSESFQAYLEKQKVEAS